MLSGITLPLGTQHDSVNLKLRLASSHFQFLMAVVNRQRRGFLARVIDLDSQARIGSLLHSQDKRSMSERDAQRCLPCPAIQVTWKTTARSRSACQ